MMREEGRRIKKINKREGRKENEKENNERR